MRFLSAIEEALVIERILGHAGISDLVFPTYVCLGSKAVL